MKKLILLMILGIFFLSFINLTSATLYHQDKNITFTVSCDFINCSDGDINLTITDPDGNLIINNKKTLINNGYISYALNSTQTANVGDYQYFISSDNDYYSSTFKITPNGEETTTGKAVFYIGLLFILLFFLGISIYFFSDTDNLLGKVASVGIGYLLIMAITFIAWNMASDFLTSSPFLIEILRIAFFVFIIGLFPLIIGLFVWYFLLLWKIKEIERLMSKGIGFDEANKRAGSGGKYK